MIVRGRIDVGDVIAGLSVAFVLIPQSLAYAGLAGLPNYRGLYAAALPPLAAALFASSPYLQTGPVAITSLLTFGALAPLATVGGGEYVALAALLALLVGLVRVLFGFVRAGWVAYLMSQPVLSGFTTAAAILIIASQIPTALGVVAQDGPLLARALRSLFGVGSWEIASVSLSLLTGLLILVGRRLHILFPGVLAAVLVGLSYSELAGYAGPVVGDVPGTFVPLSLDLPWKSVPQLILPAAVIALVGFAEPSAIARLFAAQDRHTWSPDREFVSQGVANMASAISGGFPVGGSFSRSSINRMVGGKTRWSGAVTGLAVLLFLPVADILGSLPRAILGAIVISAMLKLVRFGPLLKMLRFSRPAAFVAWTTFATTLALAPRIDLAVVIGIGLAVIVHIWRELRVHVSTHFEATTLTLKPQGVLFFASAPGLDEALIEELAAHPSAERLIVDLSGLGRIDFTGALVVKALAREAEQAGLTVPPRA